MRPPSPLSFWYLTPLALAALPLAACDSVDPDLIDTDEDGLPDTYETSVGSNPSATDSDGDGYDDGEEVWGHSDPSSETDHPYIGGWERHPWPAELETAETGSAVGDVARNFTLLDQFGEEVQLWSFYGNAILVDSSAVW